jgi:hypothetical protein
MSDNDRDPLVDEGVFGLLEALGLSPARLAHRPLRGVEVLVAGHAADGARLRSGGGGLLLDQGIAVIL